MTLNSAPSAHYDHHITTLGKWRNIPVAIGGYEAGKNHVEHFENGQWTVKSDFPLVSRNIFKYSLASLDNYLYLFGMQYYLETYQYVDPYIFIYM